MPAPPTKPFILIGYRATGKTTVGRLLAARLGWEFVDLDDHIEAGFGGSIAEIFAAEGEAGFREREGEALRALGGRERCVIATGGGAILRAENRAHLRATGVVVWLTAGHETIWSRLQADPTTATRRPNLTAGGGLQEVRAVLDVREPLYRETAEIVVNADHPSPEAVAAAILNAWLSSPSSSGASSPSPSD